jgi:DNA invertase Pin-like site-specific DNA recombinase
VLGFKGLVVGGDRAYPMTHRASVGHAKLGRPAECERIFTDKLSGAREDRPGLVALLDYVRAGDTVTVVALDRLGRSLSAVIRTIERLTEQEVLLRSLREGIDYSTSTGRMLAGIFAALAEYERELIHERAATAARAAARLVRSLRTGGESINELVRTFGVSRATIYQALHASEQDETPQLATQPAGT